MRGPRHAGLIRPGIRFAGQATSSNALLNFSSLSPQAEDFGLYTIGRTISTVPALAAGWNQLLAAFSSTSGICYRLWWWKYLQPGDTDPLPSENGRKRLRIYRGARLKSVAAPFTANTGTAGYVPAAAPIVPLNREVGVFDLYCRNAQTSMAAYLPSGATQRYNLSNVGNDEIGGDSIGATGVLGAGWAQLDPTFTNSTAFAAVSLILEPRNS